MGQWVGNLKIPMFLFPPTFKKIKAGLTEIIHILFSELSEVVAYMHNHHIKATC